MTAQSKTAINANVPIKNDLTGTVTIPNHSSSFTLSQTKGTILASYQMSAGQTWEGYLTAELMKPWKTNRPIRTYKAIQFHVHTPSEHTVINRQYDVSGKIEKQYDMELHMVMASSAEASAKFAKAPESDTRSHAVLGFFFQVADPTDGTKGDNNAVKEIPMIKAIIDNFPENVGDAKKDVKLNIGEFFESVPKKSSFWHYTGSLTTPPCGEIVNWYVNKTPLKISKKQLEKFTDLWVKASYNDDGKAVQLPKVLPGGATKRLASSPTGQGNNRPTMNAQWTTNTLAIHSGVYTYKIETDSDDDREWRNIIVITIMLVLAIIIAVLTHLKTQH